MEKRKFRLDVRSTPRRRRFFALLLLLVPIVTAVLCLCIGRYSSTWQETLSALWRVLTEGVAQGDNLAKIIRDMRLPRIVLALLLHSGKENRIVFFVWTQFIIPLLHE